MRANEYVTREDLTPPVTKASIDAARAAAALERMRIYETTGVLITDHGQIYQLGRPS